MYCIRTLGYARLACLSPVHPPPTAAGPVPGDRLSGGGAPGAGGGRGVHHRADGGAAGGEEAGRPPGPRQLQAAWQWTRVVMLLPKPKPLVGISFAILQLI